MPINQGMFEKVRDIFVAQKGVFVVPVFQRPYAWGEKEVEDLIEDIEVGEGRRRPLHYLSPIHIIKVPNPVPNVSPDSTWGSYVDQTNEDVVSLNGNGFRDDDGDLLDIRLIIDGQQRLTTLFMVFWAISRASLTIQVSGRQIPKLILNPVNDHYKFRQILGLSSPPPEFPSRSQELLEKCYERVQSPRHMDFIRNGLRTLLIELDTDYGLQAFQTQNDRGKQLTNLEKLKSLLMDFDLNTCCGVYVQDMHLIFGELYRVLDQSTGCDVFSTKDGEDQIIQLLSTYLRVADESSIDWHGASKIYEEYFRKNLKEPVEGRTVESQIQVWNEGIKLLSKQLNILNQCLLSPSSLGSEMVPSRTVGDDYRIILKYLRFSRRTLAALLKFRERFPAVEWHQRVVEIRCENGPVVDFLQRQLDSLRGSLGGGLPTVVVDKIEAAGRRLERLSRTSEMRVSALEVMERLELFIWQMGLNPDASFRGRWVAAFDSSVSPERCIQLWHEWISSYGRESFITRLLTEWGREGIYRYLLMEYESVEHGQELHFTENLALEHIFPVHPTTVPSPYGFDASQTEYERFISGLANRTFLDSTLNGMIQNHLPPDKALPYHMQSSGQYSVPLTNQVRSTTEIGRIFRAIQDDRLYKSSLEVRGLELAIFAAERFF